MGSNRRKAVIAGSAVALAGALAGAVTLTAGGRHTEAHPGAEGPAGAVRAQRVADVPAPSDSALPSPQIPDGKVIDLTVRNGLVGVGDFRPSVCITNTVRDNQPVTDQQTPGICTEPIETGGNFSLTLTQIKPEDSAAHVIVNPATAVPNATGAAPSIDLPVSDGRSRYCVALVNTPDLASPTFQQLQDCPPV